MPDTGAPYFIPYVEPTDLVRDYPDASEDLALAIVAALENIPVTEKRIEAFTGSGTWTVPAGVTYAIATMLGGGGGGGGQSADGSNGSVSSVDFPGGLVSAPGGQGGKRTGESDSNPAANQANNTGMGGGVNNTNTAAFGRTGYFAQFIVAGGAVTPESGVSVVVGAGGAKGQNGANGGSGYVYIEYFEEV
jgi:hypothetical protein